MTILIATGLYPPQSGGPATYARLLEERLPAFGFKVKVLPFSVVRHLPPVIRHAAYFFKTLSHGRDADVVLAQDTVSVGLPAGLAARLLGKKFVVRVTGDYAWEQGRQRFGVTDGIDEFQRNGYGARVALLRHLQRTTLRLAHAVIAPSRYFARLVEGWGVRGLDVAAIYNGIALPRKAAEKEALDTGIPRPYFISSGRLVPWKGFDILIRLMARLPHWHFALLGDGPERGRLEELARELGVADRVHFMGQVPREEVLAFLGDADAFVLNTSFESFSFQIVEAMAMRVPVIATRVGSIPELIDDKEEGMLCAPDDEEALFEAITSVRADPEAWERRTRQAAYKAQRFSIERTMDELQKLLKAL